MRIRLRPRPIITLHLNPFTFQIPLLAAPLPPRLSTNPSNSFLAQLCIYMVSGLGQVFVRNDLFLDFNPSRRWDLLGGECL